jgi:hypothetical protein
MTAVRRGRARKTIERLEAAIRILDEIQPATVRAVCYRLFVLGLIPNMGKSSTNSISRILTQARENGDIEWSWIVDETREAETSGRWNNTSQFVRVLTREYRRDYWQDQPRRVEVWSEKGTVRGTLGPVLEQYGVTFRVMHGYASATAANDVAEESLADERPFHVLYVGDWDPSGLHMSNVDLPARIARYGGVIQIERVALSVHDLPDLPCFSPEDKRRDPRYSWFTRVIGTQCCELDALPPPELRERVSNAIVDLLDLDLWDHAIEIERVERESIETFSRSWQAQISSGADDDRP